MPSPACCGWTAFEHQPAFVLGPRMEVLTGNAAARALLTDFPARPEHDRNLLRWVATDPAARDLYLDGEAILAGLVGVLQLEASDEASADALAQITTAGVAVG